MSDPQPKPESKPESKSESKSSSEAPRNPQTRQAQPLPLAPGDFYFDGPNLVFTAQYHLKRGVCCGSGCRHCPY